MGLLLGKFTDTVEQQFHQQYYLNSKLLLRISISISAVLYGLFYLLDKWIIPISQDEAFILRFYVVLPASVFVLALTFTQYFQKFQQTVMSLYLSIVSAGILVMIYCSQPQEYGYYSYYSGLVLCIIGSNTLMRLYFRPALFVTLLAVLGYEAIAIFKQGLLAIENDPFNRYVFLNNNFFLLSISGISLYNSYVSERRARRHFLQKRTISEEKKYAEKQREQIIHQAEELAVANDALVTNSRALSNKQNEIEASLRYSRKLQSYIAPGKEVLGQGFKEYFVLNRPRNIVSGDFYWVHISGDLKILAVADCTGHGVPGAMLSMLGMSLLKEVCARKQMLEKRSAAYILEEMRLLMKSSLRHSSLALDSKDGMDMAVCLFDGDNEQLHFAGANRPVIVCSGNRCAEYKGTRNPVGYYPNEKAFDDQVVPIVPGMMVYMFSDGYADQFGGDGGQKFKFSNFKTILRTLQSMDADMQKQCLTDRLDMWMSGHEQIDDILVLGVRCEG